MENPLIKPTNLINFPLKLPHALPLASTISSVDHAEELEMIDFHGMNYTSLKDLLSVSPPSMSSPTNSSWREIPIKDPLLQHAAWAYLQPMAEMRDEDDRWWRKLEKNCCRLFSCFHDVVSVVLNGWFPEQENDGDGKIN